VVLVVVVGIEVKSTAHKLFIQFDFLGGFGGIQATAGQIAGPQ
jgi:hypothetical protein